MPTNTTLILTATDRTRAAFDSVSSGLKSVATLATGFGVATSAALGVMVSRSSAAALELDKLLTVSGESTAKFQELAISAANYGIEQEKLADILKDTNDKVGDFMQTGGGPLKDFFENVAPKVGVTAEQFKNLGSSESLGLYVSSLDKANLSQKDMTFYMEALASDSTALIPLYRQQSEELNRQAKEAHALGLILSDVDLSVLRAADAQFKTTQKIVSSFTDHLSVGVAPVIKGLGDEFLNVAREAGGMGEIANKVIGVIVKGSGYAANSIQGISLAWTAVKHAAFFTASETINIVAAMDRGLTSFINKFTPFAAKINHDLTLLSGKLMLGVIKTRKALDDAMNAPLSSASLEAWYSNVVSMSQAAGEKLRGATGQGGEGGEGEESKLKLFIEKNRVAASEYGEIWQGAFSSVTKGAGGALADVLVDQKNGADALRAVMRSVAKSVIAGLGEIAAKKLVLFALEKAGIMSSAAVNKGAGLSTAISWAPAAAAVSLATFGANAIPAQAGMATTFGLSAGLALTGIGHDGFSAIPEDGTYYLKQNEKIINNKDSKKLDRLLDGGGGGKVVNVNFTVNTNDSRSFRDSMIQNRGVIVSIIKDATNNRAGSSL